MGENHFAPWPVVVYGGVLIMAGIAYFLLARTLVAHHGADSTLAKAIGKDTKGILSLVLYAGGIALAFLHPWAGIGLYALVAAIWFLPDRRIEKHLPA